MFEQMKGLSPKKKIEYYIQYYGAATVVILIVIIAVTSFCGYNSYTHKA